MSLIKFALHFKTINDFLLQDRIRNVVYIYWTNSSSEKY